MLYCAAECVAKCVAECVAVTCSELQYLAVYYSMLQCVLQRVVKKGGAAETQQGSFVERAAYDMFYLSVFC